MKPHEWHVVVVTAAPISTAGRGRPEEAEEAGERALAFGTFEEVDGLGERFEMGFEGRGVEG